VAYLILDFGRWFINSIPQSMTHAEMLETRDSTIYLLKEILPINVDQMGEASHA
jgi:hypothetical protein